MKNNFTIVILIVTHITYCVAFIPNSQILHVNAILDMALNCRFEEALEASNRLGASCSTEAVAPLMRLIVLGLRDLDFDITVDSSDFIKTYQRTLMSVEQYRRNNDSSSYTMTVLGLAKATLAAYYLHRKDYVNAIQEGFESLKILKTAAKMDQENIDAEFFWGLYEYAKGELKRKIWWILFWYPGNKEHGIKILLDCASKGRICQNAARMVLAEIWIREKKYDNARKLIEILEKRYPESRFVLWTKAKYYESVKQWEKASLVFDTLAASYMDFPIGEYNFLVTSSNKARMLLQAGNTTQAVLLCNELIGKYEHKTEERFVSLINDLRKILTKAQLNG